MERDITFEAEDGVELAGTCFVGDDPRAAMVLDSGTAIPRGFYRRFARHAASRGFVVLTFDYRGIGGSRPADLATSRARYRDWGQLDIPAALAWMRAAHPDLPLCVVGHSTGGQQLGLAHNSDQVRAALFVAVSTGYWRGMPSSMKWFTLLLWTVLVPVFARVLGYVPGKRLGLGEDLPIEVAREWGAWCLEPTYLAPFLDDTLPSVDGQPFGPSYFPRVTAPILWLCFDDDTIATTANVPPMQALFTESVIETRWVSPSELGVPAIGHLGFFRSFASSLWDDALDGLLDRMGAATGEADRSTGPAER